MSSMDRGDEDEDDPLAFFEGYYNAILIALAIVALGWVFIFRIWPAL